MEAEIGKVISVEFRKFDIKDDYGCHHHWFQAHDGPSQNATKLGRRLCDYLHKEYQSFESSGNTLFLTYNKNENREGKGFVLSIKIKGNQPL